VADAFIDWEASTAPAAVANVSEFVALLSAIDSTWDEFHREYDSLRAVEAELTSAETMSRLGQLVDRFRGIVVAIRQLPTTVTTREVAGVLAQAAEGEDLSLRRLRDTFQRGAEPAGEVESSGEDGELGGENAGSSASNPEAGGGVTFAAVDPTLFDAFDAQLVDANAARLEVRHKMEDILESISEV
jgi:hypothetical protein